VGERCVTVGICWPIPGEPPDLSSQSRLPSHRRNFAIASITLAHSNLCASIPTKWRSGIETADVLVLRRYSPHLNVYMKSATASGSGCCPLSMCRFEAQPKTLEDGLFDNCRLTGPINSQWLATFFFPELPDHILLDRTASLSTLPSLYFLNAYGKTKLCRLNWQLPSGQQGFHVRSFDRPISRFSDSNRSSAMSRHLQARSSPVFATHIDGRGSANIRASFLAGLTHGLAARALLSRTAKTIYSLSRGFRELVERFRMMNALRTQ